MSRAKIRFPWIGFLLASTGSFLLFVSTSEIWLEKLGLPFSLMRENYRIAVLAIVVATFLFEVDRFRRNRKRFDQQIENYENKLAEILRGKNKLQNKVQKYADHADKLKLFISDRLLEYIEYDEKFLHFQNIASEVRHNGIISYDKVHSALQSAMAKLEAEKVTVHQESDQLPEGNAEQNSKIEQYQEALRSMRYLWDLLDLSTTDNMAMYIANKLYEAEELYYHQALNDSDGPSPFSPTYDIRGAIVAALQSFIQEENNPLPKLDQEKSVYHFENDSFWVDLAYPGEMLGNENYIVLLMENLVNNALFYYNNRKYGNKHSRIAVRMSGNGKAAYVRVYNAGRVIGDEIKDQIFQLGYSTRRSKDNHGKGLGLYFVNEIVTGNEGKISYENIVNEADTYILRIELANGEKINEIISTVVDKDNKLYCTTSRSKSPQKSIDFEPNDKVKTIEVSVQSLNRTFSFHDFEDKSNTFIDPNEPAIARWSIEYSPRKRPALVRFTPLDVMGVQFNVLIPNASSRLDADFHELEIDEIQRLEQLDVDLDMETINPYVRGSGKS